ncbi:MAG: tRNA (adenosine(37)-N6)-threonylcarbamoyltransferase complex transferase subunit TsaD [Candidatus Phytoplasma pyri]|uniref:tRNA (adenosine(37)-N6)-threonylcarbamoyltransferase complex transferase subunit TsaD n=1 Tax=Candidatus Phytoplasma pyri TaxID=47566 RepID=UPI0039831448
MIILSIETSCDETSASITKDGKKVLSNIVFSQIKEHSLNGGVIPELASREHVKNITLVLEKALKEANIQPQEIDLVAFTQGPGLIGSLLVGINCALVFGYIYKKPVLGINHLLGHIYSAQIENEIEFPALVLVVSGGHTELLALENYLQIKKLGFTCDDAVGEVYDKVARILGFGYPGGPIIDELAQKGKDTFKFVRPYLKNDNFNFSFSGLKSSIFNLVSKNNFDLKEKINICNSFQSSVIDVLVEKTKRVLKKYFFKQLIITGGVAANYSLRKRFVSEFSQLKVIIPSLKYCGDQAAMIGIAAYYQFKYQLKFNQNYHWEGKPNLSF